MAKIFENWHENADPKFTELLNLLASVNKSDNVGKWGWRCLMSFLGDAGDYPFSFDSVHLYTNTKDAYSKIYKISNSIEKSNKKNSALNLKVDAISKSILQLEDQMKKFANDYRLGNGLNKRVASSNEKLRNLYFTEYGTDYLNGVKLSGAAYVECKKRYEKLNDVKRKIEQEIRKIDDEAAASSDDDGSLSMIERFCSYVARTNNGNRQGSIMNADIKGNGSALISGILNLSKSGNGKVYNDVAPVFVVTDFNLKILYILQNGDSDSAHYDIGRIHGWCADKKAYEGTMDDEHYYVTSVGPTSDKIKTNAEFKFNLYGEPCLIFGFGNYSDSDFFYGIQNENTVSRLNKKSFDTADKEFMDIRDGENIISCGAFNIDTEVFDGKVETVIKVDSDYVDADGKFEGRLKSLLDGLESRLGKRSRSINGTTYNHGLSFEYGVDTDEITGDDLYVCRISCGDDYTAEMSKDISDYITSIISSVCLASVQVSGYEIDTDVEHDIEEVSFALSNSKYKLNDEASTETIGRLSRMITLCNYICSYVERNYFNAKDATNRGSIAGVPSSKVVKDVDDNNIEVGMGIDKSFSAKDKILTAVKKNPLYILADRMRREDIPRALTIISNEVFKGVLGDAFRDGTISVENSRIRYIVKQAMRASNKSTDDSMKLRSIIKNLNDSVKSLDELVKVNLGDVGYAENIFAKDATKGVKVFGDLDGELVDSTYIEYTKDSDKDEYLSALYLITNHTCTLGTNDILNVANVRFENVYDYMLHDVKKYNDAKAISNLESMYSDYEEVLNKYVKIWGNLFPCSIDVFASFFYQYFSDIYMKCTEISDFAQMELGGHSRLSGDKMNILKFDLYAKEIEKFMTAHNLDMVDFDTYVKADYFDGKLYRECTKSRKEKDAAKKEK